MTTMLLVVMILATFRIARFVALDTFPPMSKLRDKISGAHQIDTHMQGIKITTTKYRNDWAEGITCPHCVGVYVAAIVVAITAQLVSIPQPVLVGVAVAGGQSILASFAESAAK